METDHASKFAAAGSDAAGSPFGPWKRWRKIVSNDRAYDHAGRRPFRSFCALADGHVAGLCVGDGGDFIVAFVSSADSRGTFFSPGSLNT